MTINPPSPPRRCPRPARGSGPSARGPDPWAQNRLHGRFEGRTASIQRVFGSFTRSRLGREDGKAFRRLLRDDRGVTAMLVAITLPVLLLFGALAIDTGAWFTTKRQIQSAADAAALSAAYEVVAGN